MKSRLRSDKDSDDEEKVGLLEEEIPLDTVSLHPKKREVEGERRQQPRDQTIETEIQPADTILSFSLKYNVPLAELKRVNNIIRDDEFYALKRIKIPVKPTSLLNELLPGVHSEKNRQSNGWFVETKDSPTSFGSSAYSSGHSSPEYASSPYSETRDLGEAAEPVVANLLGVESLAPESKDKRKAKKFLKELDKDLERIREKQTEFENETIEEVCAVARTSGEPSKKYTLRPTQIPSEDPGCSNRVLGCWFLVVFLLIVVVFCVLVSLMRIEHGTHKNITNIASPGIASIVEEGSR